MVDLDYIFIISQLDLNTIYSEIKDIQVENSTDIKLKKKIDLINY